MGVEEIDLLLELIRLDPVIVTFQERQVLAMASFDSSRKISHCADILVAEKELDSFRVTAMECRNHGTGTIGRTVLSDDDLIFKVHLLGEYAFDGLSDVLLMVIGNDRHA
jgi:hypothetical protein